MSDHAKYSPSGASRWLACPGSVAMEMHLPDQSSHYADHGSAAHSLLESVLQARIAGVFTELGDPRNYLDRKIDIGDRSFCVDEEMIEHVDRAATDAFIFSNAPNVVRESEQRVYFGDYIGVLNEEAFGTCDFSAVDFDGGQITVLDFKYGMGVKVFAERNEQMMLYALGLLSKYEMVGDFTQVRIVVHQPRLDHVDEWTLSVEELLVFAEEARKGVAIINGDFDVKAPGVQTMTGPLNPGEKQCRFCRAKATCLALRASVNGVMTAVATVDDFTDLTEIPRLADVPSDVLGSAMDKVGLIEDFCKAVRAEVERRLLADEAVNSPNGGYKIVQGKRGNRAWKDEDAVEKLLKSMRFKNEDMYTFKLKGVPHFEKMLAKESPTRWKKLAALFGQSDGKPSVAPMSDPRPAISKADVALAFDDLTEGE